MESDLLQLIAIFVVGLVCGALIMLLWNKLSSGSASPAGLKQEYEDYQEKVETHFEETSKKFQDMTAQYQDLYKHLSVGATSLCRPDSVAAALADESQSQVKIENKEAPTTAPEVHDSSDVDIDNEAQTQTAQVEPELTANDTDASKPESHADESLEEQESSTKQS